LEFDGGREIHLLCGQFVEGEQWYFDLVEVCEHDSANGLGGLMGRLDADCGDRYNTFFVLYPLGAGSEAWCIYTALTEAGIWNKNYYWFLVFVLATYPPGLYNQYTHMIRQRRKQMRGKKRAD
jgi:hypothetical protein